MSLSDWAYCLAYHCRYRAARRLWSFTNLILHFAVVRLEEDHGGGLKSDRVKRLKDLETENSRLRRAIADLTLDKQILTEAARGNY